MRWLLILFIPLLLQVWAFIAVFLAAQGGGSFMGLLALPVAPLALVMLLAHGIGAARGTRPLGGAMLTSLAIALVPPVLLLIFRALEG